MSLGKLLLDFGMDLVILSAGPPGAVLRASPSNHSKTHGFQRVQMSSVEF